MMPPIFLLHKTWFSFSSGEAARGFLVSCVKSGWGGGQSYVRHLQPQCCAPLAADARGGENQRGPFCGPSQKGAPLHRKHRGGGGVDGSAMFFGVNCQAKRRYPCVW